MAKKVPDHFTIPAQLALWILREKKFREFQIYLELKRRSGYYLMITPQIKKEIAEAFGVTSRTVNNTINTLVHLNWIGHNPISNKYYVRSFKTLEMIVDVKSRRGYVLKRVQINSCKSFVAAVGFAEIARDMRRRELTAAQKRWCATTFCRIKRSLRTLPCPIASSYYAKVHSCSKSTASIYRRMCESSGFISVTKSIRPYLVNSKMVPASQIHFVRENLDLETSRKIIARNSIVCIEETTLIHCLLKKRRLRGRQNRA